MDAIIEALDDAVERAGSHAALAAACGVVPTAVWNWKKRGSVPPQYCALIESHTGVMRWRLRPNDWWRWWPDLKSRVDAPAVPAVESADS